MPRKHNLRCCMGCGRDTYGLFCGRCGGHDSSAGKGRAYPAVSVPGMPLEDDYGEESNADSVCEDDSCSVSSR
jgi:hypothetical protein